MKAMQVMTGNMVDGTRRALEQVWTPSRLRALISELSLLLVKVHILTCHSIVIPSQNATVHGVDHDPIVGSSPTRIYSA